VPDSAERGGPDSEPAEVTFGSLSVNRVPFEVAQIIMSLWLEGARANVGTALSSPEVGPLVLNLLTPDVLSLILTAWRDRHPEVFGAYLSEAMNGVRPRVSRAKRAPR